MSSSHRILVTGDYGLDYNLYLAAEGNRASSTDIPTRWVPVMGGAGIIHRLLS